MMIDVPVSRPAGSRYALNAALLTLAAAALLLRTVSIAEPLGIDQSLWASAVKGMSQGQLLYRDVWEQRPPGIYFLYLLAFQVFGWTPDAIAWLDIAAATAATVLIFAVARRLSGTTTGAFAAALYALFTMPAWLYGQHGGFLERSVCETFIVVAVALGAWCAVRFQDHGSVGMAVGVGLAIGAAIVLKPNAGLYLPALLLWMFWYSGSRASVTRIAGVLVAAAVGTLVLPGLTFAWLWRLDLLGDAKVAVIDFNRFYVGQGFSPGAYAVTFSKAVFLRMKTDPIWLAGSIGAAVALWDLARTRRLPPVAGLAILWGAAAALVIIVNGARLFNSYFIQAFPPLTLMAAWLLVEGGRAARARQLIVLITVLGMATVLVQRDYAGRLIDSARADYDLLRGRVEPSAYLERFGGYANGRGFSARANAELAAYVQAHTDPGEHIFLFGISGAGVYFSADRLTAHRFLRVNFFVETDFPDPSFRLAPVTRELAARRPRYIILERLNSTSDMGKAVDALPSHPAVVEMLEGYRLETQIEDFTLYRRAD